MRVFVKLCPRGFSNEYHYCEFANMENAMAYLDDVNNMPGGGIAEIVDDEGAIAELSEEDRKQFGYGAICMDWGTLPGEEW